MSRRNGCGAGGLVGGLLLLGVACGADPVARPEPPAATRTTEPVRSPAPGRLVDIGDRELFLDCRGKGTPTVVLEPGQGDDRSDFEAVQQTLATRTTVCTYDRANVGRSGTAPTPRTSRDVVADLQALLRAADIPTPYVLAGTSAGGFFAMHFAREHPGEVVGALAMNPPPLARDWAQRAFPLLSEVEVAEERAFFRGENPELVDWITSSEQLLAAPAPDVPLVLLHSTKAQCEGEVGACSKTAGLYLELGEEYAAAWPGSRFEAVELTHAVQLADPERVVAIIEGLL